MRFFILIPLLIGGCTSAPTVTREHEWGQVKAAFHLGYDAGFNTGIEQCQKY